MIPVTLVRGGEVWAPEELGRQDVLIVGDVIADIGDDLRVPSGLEHQVIDAAGLAVVPGFIDQHIHIIGGGGGAGPATRNPPLGLTALIEAGITTAVGCLGYDVISQSLASLLAKCRALRYEGISTYMFSGGLAPMTPTLTGSVETDLAYIPDVLGVKAAIRDVHGITDPTRLVDIASKVANGAPRAAGKRPLVHVHIGDDAVSSPLGLREATAAPPSLRGIIGAEQPPRRLATCGSVRARSIRAARARRVRSR